MDDARAPAKTLDRDDGSVGSRAASPTKGPGGAVAPGEEGDGTSAAAPADGRLRRVRSLVSRTSHLWPAVLLLLLTVAVWARPVLGSFTRLRLSNPGDSESFAYYLSWNVHALTQGKDPFFTPNLYAPDGLDLGNAISVPAVSLLVAPVTAAFGGTAGYNTALLLSIVMGASAVYLLARELTGSIVGGALAGVLMVVSPYFTGHALSHLNLMWVFGLPFMAYLVVRRVRGGIGRAWFVVLVALTVAFTVGASTELLVTESVFAAIGLAVAAGFATPGVRRTLAGELPWLAAGGVGGLVLASPVIIAGLRSGIPETAGNDPSLYSTDLTNIVAPTHLILFGDSFFASLRESWSGNAAENTAYLPVTLLVLAAAVVLVVRSRAAHAAAAFALIALVLSFGPVLTIAGVPTVPMPWRLATAVPGLDHALPVRFSGFVFMALALLAAMAWASRRLPRWFVAGAVAASSVLLLPNLSAMLFPTNAWVPEFVTGGGLSDTVDRGENVLVLPAGQWGPGMRWMDELDFAFEMPTGNGGGAVTPPALGEPIGRALFDSDLSYDYRSELLPYLRELEVDTVIVDDRYPEWSRIMDEVMPGRGEREAGVWVYAVP